MKRFRKKNRLFAFILLACILVRTNICEQKMETYTETYGDSSRLSAISVPHGLHYSYLENDTQRFLYDMMYKVGTPQTVGTAQEVIFYNIGEVPTKYYYPADENDYCFARKALKYDNPDKVEYSLYEYHLKYLKNTSGTFDAYLCADPVGDYNYQTMNAQMDAAIDDLVLSAQNLGMIDLSSDESLKMTLFKLALYMAPSKPYNNNYFKNADDYDWWGIVYNWDAVRNPQDNYPHNAYAALCDKYSVCDGVSMAYMSVLKELGINDCVCIDGFYGKDHAWNLVKLNNNWYDIDVTNMTITGIEFANGEINKRRPNDSFGSVMPTSSGTKTIGAELGEKYTTERAGQYGFRQDSSSQESDNSSSSESTSGTENASDSSTGSTSSPSGNGNNGSNTSSGTSNTGNNSENNSNNTSQPSTPSNDSSNANSNASASDDTRESTSQQSDIDIPEETTKVVPATPKSVSAKVSKKTVTVKWKKQTKNTTGYEIQHSTDKKFKKNLKTVTAKKSATKTTIKKLKAKKTYYVRVRTVCKQNGKNVYSKWSKVQKVKIK